VVIRGMVCAGQEGLVERAEAGFVENGVVWEG